MFVATSASIGLIALGGVTAVVGLALFGALIRRKAIPLLFGLALIVLTLGAAWILVAGGRRAPSRTVTYPFYGPDVQAFAHELPESDAICSAEWEKRTLRPFEFDESTSRETRLARTYQRKAEALERSHERIVITEKGPVVLVPAPPPSPSDEVFTDFPVTVQVTAPDYRRPSWLARWQIVRGGLVWNLVTGLSIAALLFVGYVVLDASTRGQFTWPLRILSVMVLGVIFAALAALRGGL
ncbi:MAG: hypothetical protein PVI86_12240 [Phycisphaerae bacterium]|jgi:hypothetical protein